MKEMILMLESIGFFNIQYEKTETMKGKTVFFFSGEADDQYEIKIEQTSNDRCIIWDRLLDEKHYIRIGEFKK